MIGGGDADLPDPAAGVVVVLLRTAAGAGGGGLDPRCVADCELFSNDWMTPETFWPG